MGFAKLSCPQIYFACHNFFAPSYLTGLNKVNKYFFTVDDKGWTCCQRTIKTFTELKLWCGSMKSDM